MAVKNSRRQFLLQTPSGHVAILQFMHELPFFLYTWELSQVEYSVKQDGKVLIKMHNKIGIPSGLSYQKFTCVLALRAAARRLAFGFLTVAVNWLQDAGDSKLWFCCHLAKTVSSHSFEVLRSRPGHAAQLLVCGPELGDARGPSAWGCWLPRHAWWGCHHITLSSPVVQSYL